MKTNSRLKYYLLFGLFAISLITTLLSPAVSAATVSQMTPTEEAKSWLYFNALGACLNKAQNGQFLVDNKAGFLDERSRIKVPNALAGKWFANLYTGSVNPTIGYFLNGKGLSVSGDKVGCGGDNTDWITDATKLWGYNSPIEALCDFGFKRENGTDCTAGSDWFIKGDASLDRFRTAVKNKVYNGGNESLSTPARYVLYRDAFYSGCLGSAAPPPYTGPANDEFTYTITTVDASGLKTDTKYYSGNAKKKSDKIWYLISPQLRNVENTCGSIAQEINKMADAYARFVQLNQDVAKNDESRATPAPPGTTCAVDGIGWIICPVTKFMAKIVDASYGFVSSLLVVQPLMTTGGSEGIYTAWAIMRNFANVVFVIAFLIIIFSQLTSVGVTNYGIKKLLPRLVIAAILVNVSYWICAVAVDLSNIIGGTLRGLFVSIGNDIAMPNAANFGATGTGWTGIAGGILAATAIGVSALYIGLAALLPALVSALLAIVTVFLVLTLRQALIILLVVISPLAFVAYLLPNTESLFNKWRGLLQTLLLMYPIIALIFGASALASKIVMGTASGDYKIAIQIMGALIGIIPLALTPVVMKSAGGILNKFSGIINNPNRGPIGRMRKGAEEYSKNRKSFRQLKSLTGDGRTMPGRGFMTRRSVQRKAVLQNREREMKRAETTQIANTAAANDGDNRFARRLARGGGDGALQRATDAAINVQATIEAEEVKAANARIDRTVLDINGLRGAALGAGAVGRNGVIQPGDQSAQRAAIQQIVATNDIQGISSLVDNAHTFDGETQKILADALTQKRPGFISAGALSNIRQGNQLDTNTLVQNAINSGVYSAEKLGAADRDEVALIADNIAHVNPAAQAQVIRDANTATADPRFGAGKNRQNLDNVINRRPGVYS